MPDYSNLVLTMIDRTYEFVMTMMTPVAKMVQLARANITCTPPEMPIDQDEGMDM
jgi:hypothetical protein